MRIIVTIDSEHIPSSYSWDRFAVYVNREGFRHEGNTLGERGEFIAAFEDANIVVASDALEHFRHLVREFYDTEASAWKIDTEMGSPPASSPGSSPPSPSSFGSSPSREFPRSWMDTQRRGRV
jgi:hypothetical protein